MHFRLEQNAVCLACKVKPSLSVQELELLDEDSNIFKLVGPILIKQDPLEATSNVKKRLEFIKGELDRLDSQLKKIEDNKAKDRTQ